MTIKEQINADFIAAYKAKEMGKKDFLGLIKGEIKLNEGRGIEATDENVIKILTKMTKSAEAIMEAKEGKSHAYLEIEWMKPYMPTMMSEDEIESKLHVYMSTCNADEMNVGSIMKYFNSEFKGKVDNALLSKLVKEELS